MLQLEVMNSPFNEEQVELLNRLLPNLTEGQQIWLNGYLSALHRSAFTATAVLTPERVGEQSPATSPVSREVTLLYGSQTGNGQRLATQLSKQLEEKGLRVSLASMSDYKTNSLKSVEDLIIIVSTHGEGDPPDNALTFYEFLHSRRAPKLEGVRYAVLSLGDSSYEFFCKTGQDFDKRLAELGGTSLCDRVDCDLDFDEQAAQWMNEVVEQLSVAEHADASAQTATAQSLSGIALPNVSEYSRQHPFLAEVYENINLNGRGSARETRHLELSLEGSNLTYEPGDAVGIYPDNHPELVDALIEALGWDKYEHVPLNDKGDVCTLQQALQDHFEITVLTKPLLEKVAAYSSHEALHQLFVAGNEEELKDYLKERDLLDLVRDFAPWQWSASEFVSLLRKIPPRLYSIASSLKANEDEVHLTIRTVRYEAHGRERHGVCSIQCAERVKPGDTLRIFIQQNPNFKLPNDPDVPLIMIGPGTGVAPFRAFLAEREESGARGDTWLFYGDQHFHTDFLYQIEFQRWLKDGVLTRMDVAFSRDTPEKVYVQHRMLEKRRELFEWLERGAVVYVCGDEKHMAKDVHETLLTIIAEEGQLKREDAEQYIATMQQQKRYQRDVY